MATGSRPAPYAGIPFDDPDVYDFDRIYSLITPPKVIVITGGVHHSPRQTRMSRAMNFAERIMEVPHVSVKISAGAGRHPDYPPQAE